VLVAYACNPSYSRGRDQKDCSSKPAQASNSQDCISKKSHHKKRAQGIGPEFKPQYHKKEKKKQSSDFR
jgi:hypothetical protein